MASIQNYKDELIEWAQRHHLSREFHLKGHQTIPRDHFIYSAWINGKPVDRSAGSSRKRTQQEVARDALELLK